MYYKCIAYKVDPNLLAAGVPIEDLEKTDIREVPIQEEGRAWRSSRSQALSTPRPDSKSRENRPRKSKAKSKNTTQQEQVYTQKLQVSPQQYEAIAKGRAAIKIENPEWYSGQTMQIVNEKTGSQCLRKLYLVRGVLVVI